MSEAAAATGQETTDTGSAAAGSTDATQVADGAKTGDTQTAAAVEYTDFKLPEGVALDKELISEFKDIAKAKGLKQEDAQSLVELGAKIAQKQAVSLQEAVKKQVSDWESEAKADKEFGGEKLDENLAVAKKGLETVGNDALKALLKTTGIGSHPEVIRAFIKIGKLVSEDKVETGRGNPTDPKSLAATLYPNQ